MKNNDETPAMIPTELFNDLQAFVVEAEKMMVESATEHSAEAVSALRIRFDAAHAKLAHLYAGAKQKVAGGVEDTDETVRATPYQSIAIAAGIGLLVGVLLGRRGK